MILYKGWGETRYADGSLPTTYKFTGQRQESSLGGPEGLYYYGARWYDSYLNRWIQPDSIIPSESGIYTPLVVDYHETQFLLQQNQENRKRLVNPNSKQPTVPQNPLAYDRYAYSFNNPVHYTDPDGHNPLLILIALIGAFIFFSQVPSDVYQPDPADQGDPGVAAFGGTLMLAPTLGPVLCGDGDCTNEVNSVINPTNQSVIDKLNNYLLNPNHTVGGTKAEWFKQALGYTQDNMMELVKQIVFNPNTAIATELTQYGQKYEQIITIYGANGKTIDVLFVWILGNDGVLRLVTSIPTQP